MSEFRSRLVVELVDDNSNDGRGSWRYVEPLRYYSDLLQREVVCPAGMITDFASLPRVPLIFLRYGDRAHRAAGPHDLLYTTHEVDRETADQVFLEAMLVTGVPEEIALEMYHGLRIFGAAHWDEPGQPQAPGVQLALSVSTREAP